MQVIRGWVDVTLNGRSPTSEWQRVLMVAAYFKAAGFVEVEAFEVSDGSGNDPVYIIQGRTPGGGEGKSGL